MPCVRTATLMHFLSHSESQWSFHNCIFSWVNFINFVTMAFVTTYLCFCPERYVRPALSCLRFYTSKFLCRLFMYFWFSLRISVWPRDWILHNDLPTQNHGFLCESDGMADRILHPYCEDEHIAVAIRLDTFWQRIIRILKLSL